MPKLDHFLRPFLPFTFFCEKSVESANPYSSPVSCTGKGFTSVSKVGRLTKLSSGY